MLSSQHNCMSQAVQTARSCRAVGQWIPLGAQRFTRQVQPQHGQQTLKFLHGEMMIYGEMRIRRPFHGHRVPYMCSVRCAGP